MSVRNAKPKALESTEEEASFNPVGVLLRMLPIAVLVGVFAAFAVWAQPKLRDRIALTFDEPVEVQFAWPVSATNTTWLPEHEQTRLAELVSGMVSEDPFDQESLARAHALLGASGWFASDLQLRRLPGSVVEVQGTWRTPAAVVRLGDREHLVGLQGELLPIEYAAGQSWPVRVIEGVPSPIPTRAGGVWDFGSQWTGGSVQTGISLLALLRSHDAWEHIAGVDVREYQDNEHLGVMTRQGGLIVWGAPPASQAPGEVADADKLRRLSRLMSDPGWVSAGMPRVEIYGARVVIHETRDD